MVLSIIKGAPFIRTKASKIKKIIEISGYSSNDVMIDLGSGDGSIVIAFAEKGIVSHGYEINLFLVLWSRLRIWRRGLNTKAFIHWGNMWNVNLKPYSIVVVYGFPSIMNYFERKMQEQLLHGAKVISNSFQFNNWSISERIDNIFLYVK